MKKELLEGGNVVTERDSTEKLTTVNDDKNESKFEPAILSCYTYGTMSGSKGKSA